MKYACIDVGTNTVLLAIAEKNVRLEDILDISTITRLGEGLKKNGILSDAAMERTFLALKQYCEIMKENNVDRFFCVGTASLREAENSAVFLNKVRDKLGIKINVISEKEEACYTYLSVKGDMHISDKGVIITDIGGGSTEIIQGGPDGFVDFISLPVGSVKLTEMFVKQDPPSEKEIICLTNYVRGIFNMPFSGGKDALVGTGGTITNAASIILGLDVFQKEKIHGHMISSIEIESLIERLKSIDSYGRSLIKGMEKGREDIILQGVLLLREIMMYFGAQQIMVNANGVRYGVLFEAFQKKQLERNMNYERQ